MIARGKAVTLSFSAHLRCNDAGTRRPSLRRAECCVRRCCRSACDILRKCQGKRAHAHARNTADDEIMFAYVFPRLHGRIKVEPSTSFHHHRTNVKRCQAQNGERDLCFVVALFTVMVCLGPRCSGWLGDAGLEDAGLEDAGLEDAAEQALSLALHNRRVADLGGLTKRRVLM